MRLVSLASLAFLAALCLALVSCAPFESGVHWHRSSPVSETQCTALPRALDPALKGDLDAVVDRALTEGFAGQVAILHEGALLYERVAGTADLEGAHPVTPITLFQVASITKYFTAALTLRAVEDGLVALDDSVAPYTEGTIFAARDVTFEDLLAHRSGLGSSYAAENHSDPQAALEAIDQAGLDETRAGTFRYSNDGYDVLAIVLERLYGRAYEDLVRERLLAPACLTDVGFWGEVELTGPQVVSQPLRPIPAELHGRNYGMVGSGGLLITAGELVAWQQALRRGWVLSPGSLEALFAPRGEMSLGQATFGAFLIDRGDMGEMISARGYEDWGDNATLNEYVECGLVVAIVTSRGPAESLGRPPFRASILAGIEPRLASLCRSAA